MAQEAKKPTKRIEKDPETMNDVALLQRRIAELMRRAEKHAAKFNAARDALAERETAHIEPIQEEILALAKRIYTYAENNRLELTDQNRKKTVPVPKAGSFRWYSTPAALAIANSETLLDILKDLKFTRFIRIKEEINREALLSEPDVARSLQGVTLGNQQKFAIKLSNSKARIEYNIDTLQWKIAGTKS